MILWPFSGFSRRGITSSLFNNSTNDLPWGKYSELAKAIGRLLAEEHAFPFVRHVAVLIEITINRQVFLVCRIVCSSFKFTNNCVEWGDLIWALCFPCLFACLDMSNGYVFTVQHANSNLGRLKQLLFRHSFGLPHRRNIQKLQQFTSQLS